MTRIQFCSSIIEYQNAQNYNRYIDDWNIKIIKRKNISKNPQQPSISGKPYQLSSKINKCIVLLWWHSRNFFYTNLIVCATYLFHFKLLHSNQMGKSMTFDMYSKWKWKNSDFSSYNLSFFNNICWEFRKEKWLDHQ